MRFVRFGPGLVSLWRSLAVDGEWLKKMPVLFEGKGFEVIGGLWAIVAVALLFDWQGFW
ncbi:MAG: hypothetical protein WBA93_12185 [Microcoleaceae cyanobacterium]